jgi:hypothetical protein
MTGDGSASPEPSAAPPDRGQAEPRNAPPSDPGTSGKAAANSGPSSDPSNVTPLHEGIDERPRLAFVVQDDVANAPFFVILPGEAAPSLAQLKLYARINALLEPLVPRPDAPTVVRHHLRQLRAIATDGLLGDDAAAAQALAEVDKLALEARTSVLRSAQAGAFEVKRAEGRGKLDLLVTTRHGVVAPEDQVELLVRIQRLITVIQVMFRARRRPWWERAWQKPFKKDASSPGTASGNTTSGNTASGSPDDLAAADPRAEEYLDQLFGIAGIGLQSDPAQVKLANQQLAGFQEQLVSREAARIKNGYMRRFLVYVLVAVLLLAVLPAVGVWLAQQLSNEASAWVEAINSHRNFAILLIGATVGAWLSFGMRKVVIGFSDLAALEEDRLDPPVRILFVCGLALILGLLFVTGAVKLQIGGFDTDFMGSVSKALLIGLFCGVSEQALAGAVGRRASEFMSGVSGGPERSSAK